MSSFFNIALFLLVGHILAERCQNEEPLPTHLTFNALNDFHLHGEFRFSFNSSSYISFELKEESYFRVSVNEHNLADIDIYLHNDRNETLDFSMNLFRQEMIAKLLPIGKYSIFLETFSIDIKDDELHLICQQITMEIAISPKTLTHTRRNQISFPHGQFLPTIDLSALDVGGIVTFDSSDPTNLNKDLYNIQSYNESSSNSKQFVSIHHFEIDLKLKPGTKPIFELEFSLGFDFLNAGSLFLLLDEADEHGNPKCKMDEVTQNDDRLCLVGSSLAQNHNSLRTTLSPGKYSLWIFDKIDRRFPDLLTPAARKPDPITFYYRISQSKSEETIVSCDASPLPTSLNVPGLIDDTGYLSFREKVLLDLSKTSETSKFIVYSPFYFRLWAEPHRIDLDFEVIDSDNNTLAKTFQGSWETESVMLSLEANKEYTLVMTYFGSFDSVFCESILMEIYIQPKTPHYTMNYCQTAAETVFYTQNITNLTFGRTFNSYQANMFHFWKTDNHTESIYVLNISAQRDMILTVNLAAHFLSGLTLQFETITRSGSVMFTAPTVRDGFYFRHYIANNTLYRLHLSGMEHQIGANLRDFPRCVMYSLSYNLYTGNNISTQLPCKYRQFPRTLNTAQFLEASNRIHFQDVFRVFGYRDLNLSVNVYKQVRNITFIVKQRSLLRVVSEEKLISPIDTDFELIEDNITVREASSDEHEERLIHILVPGKSYKLSVIMYADYARLSGCEGVNLELEIAPVQSGDPAKCSVSLPPNTIDLSSTSKVITPISKSFSFQQFVKIPFVTNMSFTIPEIAESMFMKIELRYDFLWSDLSLLLAEDAYEGNTIAVGTNAYNKNQLTTRLLPGKYRLFITEAAAIEKDELQRCAEFYLMISFAPARQSSLPISNDKACTILPFSHSLNVVTGLSPLNSFSFHDQRTFRLPLNKHEDDILLVITEDSYLRVFVPPFNHFDVDVFVHTTDEDGEQQDEVAHSGQFYDEENIFVELKAGKYRLKFKYFFVPEGKTCLGFPAEYGIVTKKYFNDAYSNLVPSSKCSSNSASWNSNITYSNNVQSLEFYRSLSQKNFSIVKSFHVVLNTILRATLDYTFMPGHLYFRLIGTNIGSPFMSSPINRTFPALLGDNQAFFDHLLYPGDYQLVVDDFSNYSSSLTTCTKFTISYQLDFNIPPEYCDDADVLPTDLYSFRGRSTPYGGPQDVSTGEIYISNRHFMIPPDDYEHEILFKIRKPSWIRVWAKVEEGTQQDIDFWIYSNSSKKRIIGSAMGSDHVESHTQLLMPQSEPYLLVVYVFSRAREDCTFFSF